MSKKKYSRQELAVSRVIIMLFALALLSVLTFLYIMPFKKHSLQINNYYSYIEYAVMILTFAAFVCSCIFASIKRKVDYSQKIITPSLFLILSCSAFVAAILIPLSANRTLSSKYAIIAYLCIFIAYAVYYFISKPMAYQAAVCGIYCILLRLTDVFFSDNVTFNDAPIFSYGEYMTAFAGLLVLVMLVTFAASKKYHGITLWYTSVLSLITAAAILTRIFILKYVATAAVILLIVVFVALSVIEKRKLKNSH